MRIPAVLAAALLVLFAAPLAAQSVKVEFRDGKVDLSAQNATVRAILQEWARQGGTRIINGERVPGAPVTLELVDVHESQAIEILLRGVSGYVVGPREAPAPAGASGFDRILIMPTSSAPRPAPPSTQTAVQPGILQPRRLPSAADGDDPDDETDVVLTGPQLNPGLNNVRPGGLANPRLPPPGVRQRIGSILDQNPQGGISAPAARERLQQIIEEDFDETEPEEQPPATNGAVNPFTAAPGAARPGVIAPVPQPAQRPPSPEQ